MTSSTLRADAGNLLPRGHLHTRGAEIVTAAGVPVRLAGVNWYGFECESMVPGGLDFRTVDEICQLIVELGFNHVRLPYCDEFVFRNPPVTAGLSAMPALQGRNALEVLDAVIDAAGRHRLKVIIDNHRSNAGWSGQGNGLWYAPPFTPAMWRASLTAMARRYLGNDTVIGIDLRNEPGTPSPDENEPPRNGGAVWGEPDWGWWPRHPRNWVAAAERAGNEVLSCNPDLLIIVEGVRGDPAGPTFDGVRQLYWPGGNLSGVRRRGGRRWRARPIHLRADHRLVYSVHDYGPSMQPEMPWCRAGTTASTAEACRSVWEPTWGFIARSGLAPVYVGEFGTLNGLWPGHAAFTADDAGNAADPQSSWFRYLVAYIDELGASWAYWPLNGRNSPGGGRDPADLESYGLLTPDYSGPSNPAVLAMLSGIQTNDRSGRAPPPRES